MSQAFTFIVQAGQSVDQLTGGLLIGLVVAAIAGVLFARLVGIVVEQFLKR